MSRLLHSLGRLAVGAGLLTGVTSAQAADVKLPEFSRHQLDNGATVLLMPKHDVPLVALDVTVRGGPIDLAAQLFNWKTAFQTLFICSYLTSNLIRRHQFHPFQ